jgi:hypothetical protein
MIEHFKANNPVTFANEQARKTFIVPKETEIFRVKTIALSGTLANFSLEALFIQNVRPLKPFVFNKHQLIHVPGKENVFFFADSGYKDIIIPKGHKTVTFALTNPDKNGNDFILNFNCEFLKSR